MTPFFLINSAKPIPALQTCWSLGTLHKTSAQTCICWKIKARLEVLSLGRPLLEDRQESCLEKMVLSNIHLLQCHTAELRDMAAITTMAAAGSQELGKAHSP